MEKKDLRITKASGEKALFSEEKLRKSLEKSGASEAITDRIVEEISAQLVEGMSTRQIYSMAFSLLKKNVHPIAAKYSLKQAIMALGPSGYPFEKYIGEILKFQGYKVEVGVLVKGWCITHEVDVLAEKEDNHFMIECKFHNRPGRKTDVKVPLYIQSRFLDVSKNWKKLPGHMHKFHQGWVVTNTKFSADAITYGKCVGLNMMGWDYPKNGSLSDRIALSGLHPLTCLTTLSKPQKHRLLELNMVLCKDILNEPEILKQLSIRTSKANKVLREIQSICKV